MFSEAGGSFSLVASIPRCDKENLTGALASGVAEFLLHYILMPKAARVVLPLWDMGTYVHDDYFWCSYLNIKSPEPGSGKTNAGDVLGEVSWRGSRPLYGTMAAIRDYIDAHRPTLVLDEWDSMPSDMRKLYSAILNSGTRKDGSYWYKSGGQIVKMSTFGPKIIIGRSTVSLPDATLTRCIPILLDKAKLGEVQQFDESAREKAGRIRAALTDWAVDFKQRIVKVEPKYPKQFTEPRQVDIARPLLTIADACGGQWPYAAREALVKLLCEVRSPVPENQLLHLVKRYQTEMASGQDYFTTEDFVRWANAQEDRPWPTEKLTRQKVNAVLSAYKVQSRETHRRPQPKFWAYWFVDFREVFDRYLR